MARVERNRLRKATIERQLGSGARGTKSLWRRFFTAAIKDESGQALIWVALSLMMLLGMAAFAVDLGHAMLVRKQLQTSADAAALAAAWHLADGTYVSVADTYSSTGTLNGYFGYTVDTPVVTPKCSTTVASFGPTCDATATPPTYNMVIVQETAHVPTFFAGIIGFRSLTVTSKSAASKGARPTPANIAFVLDTTNSMSLTDTNCGHTQEACAEGAIATILAGLDPSIDKVSMFTFPGMDANTVDNDYDCSGKKATGVPYAFPATSDLTLPTPLPTSLETVSYTVGRTVTNVTYEITGGAANSDGYGFLDDYISSYGASSLASGSDLVQAIGASTGCKGLVPNTTQNTYFAATIYQAQLALEEEQATERVAAPTQTTQNVMIIISDGNANAVNNKSFSDMSCSATGANYCPAGTVTLGVGNSSDGTYPNLIGQCKQAITAAKAATADGTWVFTIAYGAISTSYAANNNGGNNGACQTDRQLKSTDPYYDIAPCDVMADMASTTSDFYSDNNDSAQGDANCKSGTSTSDLDQIAQDILSKLSESRLVPPDVP